MVYQEMVGEGLNVAWAMAGLPGAVSATFNDLLQLIGHNVVLRADDTGALSAEACSEAVSYAQSDYKNDVCKTTMAALSEKDGEFLVAMSEDDESSSIADVAQRMGVTYDYAQKYRRRLIDAGVIEVPTRGKVAFVVPFLADYLREGR